jgi:hypothetical protein
MNSTSFSYKKTVIAALTFTSTIFATASFAAVHTDRHGNVGYDSAVELSFINPQPHTLRSTALEKRLSKPCF